MSFGAALKSPVAFHPKVAKTSVSGATQGGRPTAIFNFPYNRPTEDRPVSLYLRNLGIYCRNTPQRAETDFAKGAEPSTVT